jgi:pSer/pThr/pTyr-binding forkhead associated (FHA) protein
VTDNSVSRKHALVQCGPSGITVKDLGSSNGTFISDEPVRGVPVSVQAGQRLRFGSMVFLLNAPGMAQTVPPVAPAPLRSLPSQAAPSQAAPLQVAPVQAAPVATIPSQAAPTFQPPPSAPARVVAVPPPAEPVALPWGRVAVLALAPLSLLILLVVAARTLLGGGASDLAAVRAELVGATQAIQEASAKKTQGDWTGAETILSKALTTAPGDPALRALYTEVHFEAQNFAHLAEAKARLAEKKYAEASEALQQIAPESAAAKEAEALRVDASRRLQIGRLLSASDSCGARDYKRCAVILCEYLREETRDPDALALAALAGREAPGVGCVASASGAPAVPLLDRYRASVEERYASNPAMKDAALLFFSGEIDKASDALSSASQDPANASQRGALDTALASLAKAREANRRFREMLDQEKLNEAERAASLIWEQEEVLFGKEKSTGEPIRGSLGHYARNDLVDRFTKQATAGALNTPNDWNRARQELSRAKQLDPRGESFAYYAAALRLQAAIREACEDASADPSQARLLGEAALTFLAPQLTFREQLAAKLAAPR